MRRKDHAGTAIVATMEYPNDSLKTCVLIINLYKKEKELGISLTLPNFSKLFFSFFEDNVFT